MAVCSLEINPTRLTGQEEPDIDDLLKNNQLPLSLLRWERNSSKGIILDVIKKTREIWISAGDEAVFNTQLDEYLDILEKRNPTLYELLTNPFEGSKEPPLWHIRRAVCLSTKTRINSKNNYSVMVRLLNTASTPTVFSYRK